MGSSLEKQEFAADAGPVTRVSSATNPPGFAQSSGAPLLARPLKILLLEDVPHDAELIHRELLKAGLSCEPRRVDTVDDFLRELKEFDPQIILADYALPQFSALDALRVLREEQSGVPVILVTGSHSEEVAVECMKEGADDYILKASLKRLPSAVRNSLKKREAELERVATEAAFRRSEEQYRLIAENTGDLIGLLDLENRFLYASPSYAGVLGHDPKDLAGTAFVNLIHREDATGFKEVLNEALFLREARNVEARLRHTNGQWRIFESAVSFIFNEGGKAERALIVSRDTTERRRAEKEIRKLAAFPQFNPNPVLEFKADGTLTYFNDAAMEMARSLAKSHPQALLPLNTGTIIKVCLATGQNQLHVDNIVAGRTVSWSFCPIMSNRVVHCYAEDITESLNMEAQLRQAQKMESVGQLAAGVAHDFNNILTIIQGHAGLLLSDESLVSGLTESARQIGLAAERAANLTRQLLMFSRKQVMQPQLLDLNEVVSDVSKMLRSLLGEQITLRRNSIPDLPPVCADRGMMEQVLVNLAVNSRDAMPKGGNLFISTFAVEIDDGYVQRHPEARPGCYVCLSVCDNGHGMDEATLSRIFEPFFTTKEIGKGTGLGLATVYGIVQQHQGWPEVQSEVGKGTTFKVFLPVSSKAPQRHGSATRQVVPGGDETILVVEDEPALRELVQEILQKKGYRVLDASTGVKALKVWEEHKDEIDLLLTDMMMPEGVSGRELADQLLLDRPNLKVIYTSGYSLDVVSPEFNIQDTIFLQKPYHPETLAQTVWDCLNKPAK